MDYFSLSKVKQKCFQAEKKKRRRSWVKKFLFFHGCISSSHWGVGGAVPALVGGCVLLVPSFNTNEEELVMRAFGEEHSVKTAARVSEGIG